MNTAEEKLIGKVLHVYNKISVVVLKPSETLRIGDTIRISGKAGINFIQTVESMEIDHKKIQEAKADDEIGLKVNEEVREGCDVFKI